MRSDQKVGQDTPLLLVTLAATPHVIRRVRFPGSPPEVARQGFIKINTRLLQKRVKGGRRETWYPERLGVHERADEELATLAVALQGSHRIYLKGMTLFK